jgi:hypothetical protein
VTIRGLGLTLVLAGSVVAVAASESHAVRPMTAGVARTEQRDPLFGTWRTAPVPLNTVERAILRAHYTQADIDIFEQAFSFTKSKSVRFSFKFYREGSKPFVLQKFWDAAKPSPADGDHGPYKLLPGGQFAITSADPKVNRYRYVFAYHIKGTMTLRLVSATNPGSTKKDLRFDKVVMIATASAPFIKMH